MLIVYSQFVVFGFFLRSLRSPSLLTLLCLLPSHQSHDLEGSIELDLKSSIGATIFFQTHVRKYLFFRKAASNDLEGSVFDNGILSRLDLTELVTLNTLFSNGIMNESTYCVKTCWRKNVACWSCSSIALISWGLLHISTRLAYAYDPYDTIYIL